MGKPNRSLKRGSVADVDAAFLVLQRTTVVLLCEAKRLGSACTLYKEAGVLLQATFHTFALSL